MTAVDAKSIQLFLRTAGGYAGPIDGDLGPASLKAAAAALATKKVNAKSWPDNRKLVGVQQLLLLDKGLRIGVVDGIPGPVFQYAVEQWQNLTRDLPAPEELIAGQPTIFPRQKDVVKVYGEMGKNQTMLVSPYPLYLDWAVATKVPKFSIHEKVHDSALAVMNRVLDHYGPDKIHELGLDQFSGCLNVRRMRGGNAWSMHSWGIAIDWDADRNPLRANSKTAFLNHPESRKFLDLWVEAGWTSLGRSRDFDWQHVQAARF